LQVEQATVISWCKLAYERKNTNMVSQVINSWIVPRLSEEPTTVHETQILLPVMPQGSDND